LLASFGCNGCGAIDPLVQPHAAYLALGINAERRCTTYREFVAEVSAGSEPGNIRSKGVEVITSA